MDTGIGTIVEGVQIEMIMIGGVVVVLGPILPVVMIDFTIVTVGLDPAKNLPALNLKPINSVHFNKQNRSSD